MAKKNSSSGTKAKKSKPADDDDDLDGDQSNTATAVADEEDEDGIDVAEPEAADEDTDDEDEADDADESESEDEDAEDSEDEESDEEGSDEEDDDEGEGEEVEASKPKARKKPAHKKKAAVKKAAAKKGGGKSSKKAAAKKPKIKVVEDDDADDAGEGGSGEEFAPPGPMSELSGDKDWGWSLAHETCEVPIASIKLSKHNRTPKEEEVSALARSIKSTGGTLLNPIVIGTDMVLVAGRKRLEAYKALGRKTIPARVAAAKDGTGLKSTDAFSVAANLIENAQRSELTATEKAKAYKHAIDSGAASDSAELAKLTGLSRSHIDQYLMLADNGSKDLLAALDESRITAAAATALIRKSKDDAKVQKALLENLLTVSTGKSVQRSDVERATGGTKTKRGKGTGSGRRASRVQISNDVTQYEVTGVTMSLRKTADGSLVCISMEIPHDGSFKQFDCARIVAKNLAQIDAKDLRSELEASRKRLDGED